MVITPSAPSAGKTRRHGTGNKSQTDSRYRTPWLVLCVLYNTCLPRARLCVYTWLKTHTVNTTYISAGFLRPASATPPSHTHRAPPRAPAPRGACVCTLQLELVGLSTLPLHASSGPNQKRAAAKRRCQSVPVRTGTERRTTRGPRRNAVPVSPPPATTCTTRGRPLAASSRAVTWSVVTCVFTCCRRGGRWRRRRCRRSRARRAPAAPWRPRRAPRTW